jgi:preprotein translocase subunit Sec61beta
MANDNQVQMPSSQGGLVQYFDSDAGFEVDPRTVIGIGAGFGGVMLALQTSFIMNWIRATLLGA